MERLANLSSLLPPSNSTSSPILATSSQSSSSSPPSSSEPPPPPSSNNSNLQLHILYTTQEEERAILERIVTVTSHFLIPAWLITPLIGLYKLKVSKKILLFPLYLSHRQVPLIQKLTSFFSYSINTYFSVPQKSIDN